MEPFPPPSGDAPCPPTHDVVCAACGPLSEGELRAVGGEGRGLLLSGRLWSVPRQPRLAELARWLAQDAAAREALERVEALRAASGRGAAEGRYSEWMARARYALLVGRKALFRECYRRYAETKPCCWHPDRHHFDFWDGVLGVGWADSQAVPTGAAREDIAALTERCYAFAPLPPHAALRREGEVPLVARALREADVPALKRLSKKGSTLAAAASALLAGQWAESCRLFLHEFGVAGSELIRMEKRGVLPLLPYALLTAVLAGMSRRVVQAWLEGCRSMLSRAFPASLAAQQRELGLFLDHAEYLDEQLNRGGEAACPEPRGGAVARCPLLLGWRALPATLRRRLDAPAALETLAGQGLRTLAACVLAGLRGAGVEETAFPACTSQLPRLPLPERLRSPSARFLDALEQAAAETRRPSALMVARGSGAPLLRVDSRGEAVELRLSALPARPEAVLRRLARCWEEHGRDGLVRLEQDELPRLLPLLEQLQGSLRVEGRAVPPQQLLRRAEPVVVMALAYLGEGTVLASPRLRLLPGAEELSVPACGPEQTSLHLGGELLGVQRDVEQERQMEEELLARLRALWPGELRPEAGLFWLQGLPAAADWLRVCEELGLECHWEPGRELSLQRGAELSLRVAAQGHEWLELGAECVVDETLVLSPEQLAEAAARREGDFLPLPGGGCVQLTGAAARRLDLLELLGLRAARARVSRAALPLLAAWSGVEGVPDLRPAESAELPGGFCGDLRPYQREGFAWLAARAEAGVGAFLADDMGLGKTVQCLALLLHQAARGGDAPSLVVAPVSLLGNWAAEAARFAPGLRVHTLPAGGELPPLTAGELLLVSYGQLVSRLPLLRSRRWNLLVLDEAQAIKNPQSRRARAACALEARARFCLTGTPIENSLLDLWSEMNFLNPGLLGSRAAFMRRYRREDAARLRTLLAPLVLRRRKAEVLPQLPPLTEMVQYVELSRAERALYESLRRAALTQLAEGGERLTLLAELMRLRRACCHGRLALPGFRGDSTKMEALAEMAAELRAGGHRLLVFSQFTDVLDLAAEQMAALGLETLRLDGSTPARERSARVRRFQDGGADAFLISLKAGGAGLNLTAADYVILLDPWWNPAVEAQAAGRAHRMGQGQPVTLCRLIARDTVEERILALQRDKRELAADILEAPEGAPLSPEALRALLEE